MTEWQGTRVEQLDCRPRFLWPVTNQAVGWRRAVQFDLFVVCDLFTLPCYNVTLCRFHISVKTPKKVQMWGLAWNSPINCFTLAGWSAKQQNPASAHVKFFERHPRNAQRNKTWGCLLNFETERLWVVLRRVYMCVLYRFGPGLFITTQHIHFFMVCLK